MLDGDIAVVEIDRMMRQLRLLVFVAVGGTCGSPAVPEFVDCSVFPTQDETPYVLPYAVGQRFEVGNTFGHYRSENGGVGLFAIDFRMPIATEVTAARAGVVVAVEERYRDDDHEDLHENWVMVRHADGTIARYIHLTRDGAVVTVGDSVRQGDMVGRSGNSGASSRPHLHFDVQTCGPNLPPAYNALPCGQTVPVTFRNTMGENCGLVEGSWYRAEPFVADTR